jgi:hypothetical protein
VAAPTTDKLADIEAGRKNDHGRQFPLLRDRTLVLELRSGWR